MMFKKKCIEAIQAPGYVAMPQIPVKRQGLTKLVANITKPNPLISTCKK